MEPIIELHKRANESGIRFVKAEIETASSLLLRMKGLSDPKDRMRCLREAASALEYAAHSAGTLEFPDSEGDEIRARIHELKERLDQLSSVYPRPSAPKLRLR